MNIDNNEYMDNTHNTRGALARLFTRNTGAASAADTAGAVTSLKNAHSKRGERSPISAKKSWKGQRSTAMSTTRTSGRQLSERQGSGMSRRGRRFVAAVTALMLALPTMTGVFGFSAPAFADDLTDTVPNNNDGYETIDGNSFYSDIINTGFGPDGPYSDQYPNGIPPYGTNPWSGYGPSYGPYTVPGVLQSQSTTSATSFAAGLPLGTIYIDQSKITSTGGTYKVVSDNTAIIAGLGRAEMTDGGLTMGYDGTKEGAIKMVPGKINKLDGDLFTVTYKDAAVLPNGERADFVITYSNAQIVIDQRYLAAPDGTKYYELTDWVVPTYERRTTNGKAPSGWSATTETFEGLPVYKDAAGTKYVEKIDPDNNKIHYYHMILGIGSDPLDLDPSTLTDTNRTYDYYGESCPIYTDSATGKEYIKPGNHQYYHGSVGLAQGNSIRRTGTDKTSFRNAHYVLQARAIVNDTIKAAYGDSYTYGSDNDSGGNGNPVTGTTLDVTYKVVNKDGTPAAGTFVFGICGVNLDRDPDTGTTGNNVGRPLWYSYADDFEGGEGKEHSFFSEAVEILAGQVSDYVYVRPNSDVKDNPEYRDVNGQPIPYPKGEYFSPNVSLHDGNIKFIGNQTYTPSAGGNDNSYSAGFVTLANAATGFTIRSSGHGGAGGGMNSLVFNSKQIWYRYTESTGKHGSIAVTSEGNFGGTLSDGTVYKPEGTWDNGDEWDGSGTPSGVGEAATHVVAEGKTVTYTMTPDIGYKISKLWVGAEWNDDKSPIKYREITFDDEAIAAMKKGDTLEITTAAGKEDAGTDNKPNKGLLTYNEDGTYTLTFDYAEHHEAVHVEWEPTTADILVAKVWDDKDDKDGLRAAAYADPATTPNVKLQWFIGGQWEDVPADKLPEWTHRPPSDVNPQEIPDGKDADTGKYLDGRYEINRDPNKDSTDPDVIKHPFTWEYLPVYSYDRNGVADKLITYRIVEVPDLKSSDYKAPEYTEESFTLDSSMNKSRDGFQLWTDGTTQYIKKGDGKYYEVDSDGIPGANPATTQPTPESLRNVALDPSEYYTVDKGTPYQTVDVRNEHKPYEIYIEFTKNWNDAAIQAMKATDGNEYARKDLHFTLHGTIGTNGSTKPVDLNGDEEGDDIVVVISKDEKDTKGDATGNITVDGQEIATDGTTNYVLRDEGEGEQYYTYTTNEDGTYSYTVAAPQPTAADLNPVAGDRTYKINDYNFGALIENLPTHSEGKLIEYTLTETDSEGNSLDGKGWIVTGGQLTPGYGSDGKLQNYTTQFVNTPVIDDTTSPLPVTIQKKDAVTKGSLEGAIFTVYADTVSKTKASESATEEIGGKTVYTDGTTKYVLQDDGGEDKYFEVGSDGTVAPAAADPQPNPANLFESKTATTEEIDDQTVYTDGTTKYVLRDEGEGEQYYTYEDNGDGTYSYTKADNQDAGTMRESQLKGAVDENEVVTNANGQVTINFNAPGTYYVVETKAPAGYEADSTVYTFVVDKNLKSVTLEDADDSHDQSWWNVIYELLFGNGTTLAENWEPSDAGKSGTLTVENDPIRANILIAKRWDDNNNQDGLRDTNDLPQVKLEKTTDPTDDESWTAVNSQAVPAEDKVIPDHDAPITVDQDNYYTWGDLPAYENGKLLYYRVKEFGGTLPGGGAFLPNPDEVDHPEEVGYAWTALTATGNQEEFNIAKETTTETGTTAESTNRTVTVMNKHIPQKVNISVSKDWADDDDDTSGRVEANLTLYKTVNGAKTVVETLDGAVPLADATKFHTWDNLPAFENGAPITYTVEESAVPYYATTYTTTYTKTDDTAVPTAGNSVDTSDIKRTWSGNGDTRVETTEATVNIRNANLRELKVYKTWMNGANSNVTYKLYRTTSSDPAVTDWEQAKVGSPGINDPNQTLYNWTPDSNWEEVTDKSVDFAANIFSTSATGDRRDKTLEGLPKADDQGHTYTYRVWEQVDTSRYEANQISNTEVVNTNIHATDGIANVNVVKELKGRDWTKSDSFTDRFYFKIEPYEDDGTIYHNADAYGLDAQGNKITDPTKVPMPKENQVVQGIADVDKDDTQVGAIGRNVNFAPIQYTVTQVDMGQTAEYYYKVYEVYDANGTELDLATNHTGKKDGITYAGEIEEGLFSNEFKPTVHTLKIVVSSDSTGKITTALFWDGNETQSAVPVYTNTYDSSAEVHAHVIKEVQGREIEGDDAFNFTITNMAGAPMRRTENGTANTTTQSHNAGTITESSGSKVQAGTGGYDPVDVDGGSYRAMRSDSSTWIKVSDLSQRTSDGKATDTFIYRLAENAANSVANDNDLTFDKRHIYLKVVATDNLDGTITIEKSYWYDETCNTNQVDAKVLTAKADGTLAPDGSSVGDDYAYEDAAIFTNTQTIDIPVVKEWKGGPAVENVTLHLQRHLYPITGTNAVNEADITVNKVTNDATAAGKSFWESVGNVTTAPRDHFVNTDGTPKYDEGSNDTASKRYENIEGFNKDLPKYVTDENGVTYRAVYNLVEDKTSDAYNITYRSEKDGEEATPNNQIFIDGETLVVTNTVTATNEANIAAVKQLLGRQWLSKDKDNFSFTLEPAGKGKYKADGSFDGIDDTDDAKATVPMPERNDDRQSTTTGTVATTHAWDDANNENSIVVDQNGNLERLARFGAIKFDINDLTWVKDHYEGDFFYTMKEKVPEGATQNTDGTYTKGGITYDKDSHTVHVKVTGNRTNKLYVQIAYDEKTEGNVSTGTQFTPVYTNRYTATGDVTADVNKYVMGRDFVDGETFTFKATPLGGAPMVDKTTGERYDNREAILTASGTDSPQTLTLPEISFTLDDLAWTVGENGAPDNRDGARNSDGTPISVVKDSNGNNVLAGMKYARFMYAIKETGASATDLKIDPDTEYIRVTVIDKGDGTLDTSYEVFEDRYGIIPRYTPNTDGTPSDDPATAATFVNKLKRDLDVTKVWTNPATSDVTLHLQWSTDGTNWTNADGTSWLADVKTTHTIPKRPKDSEGDALTAQFKDLPAYVNDTNDNIDLNDKWVYYRVVEDTIAGVETRYSTEAYADGDEATDSKYSTDPIVTEAEDADSRVTQTYVMNFVDDLEGKASVNVVKQLIGRGWTDSDSFGFTITPKESKIGKETTPTPASERAMPMPMGTNADTGEAEVDNTATATTRSKPVTVGEYNATFKDIIIKLSDLALNDKNVATGEFVYTIKETVPDDATEITGTDGKTYYVIDNIKYTAAEHTVTIVATNDGAGTIDITVSYDGRKPGDFVPVYTNEAIVPTPIEGSKTWVGGEASEHVNANDEGVDALGITLQRKTSATNWEALTEDDAKRDLVVVWEDTEGNPQYTGNGRYVIKAEKVTTDPDTGDETTENVDPVLDTMDNTGDRYEYRIVENSKPADYAVTYETTGVTNNDITNTSTKKDSLKVTKTWEDDNNAEGLRPDKVVMHLYKQVSGSNVPVEVASQEIPKGAETTGITWGDLPVYDKDGNKITYVVIEEAEFGYTTTYKVLNSAAEDYATDGNSLTLDGDTTAAVQTIDVKNELTPATDSLSVTKVWNDDNDRDGNRPLSVSVNVYEHVWTDATDDDPAGYVKNTTPVHTFTLNADGNWTGTKSDLPRTKNGRTVFYTVGEDVSDTNVFGAPGTEGKYSNAPVVTGNQVEGFTVTNNYTPETIDIQATKVWGDLALQLLAPFGYDRPTTVSFQLKADGTAVGTPVAISKDSKVEDTEWAYQWTDLPKYKNGGTAIDYTVEELPVPGYTPTVTGNMTDGFTVTNTVKKNGVTVKKQFLDAETGEPIPASSIPTDFVIHANYTAVEEDDNGDIARVVKDVELKIADATGPSDDGTYTWTLEDVVTGTTVHVHENNYRDADKYTFKQVTTTGPDANAKIHTDDTNFVMSDGAATVSFVNEYTKQKGNLELVKNWNDDSDRDGKRPENIMFTVTATVGENNPAPVFATADEPTKNTTTVTLTGGKTDASWSDKSLTNLPLYDADGNQITYTLSEGTVPEGYSKSLGNPYTPLTSGATETLSITNTHIPAMDSLTVTKAWSDNDNAAGLRPDSVTFHLYKTVSGGADVSAGVAPKPVNADDNWTATWTGLPVYENGEKITYKVVEEAVAGYKTPTVAPATIKLDAENDAQEVTVTNELVAETTEVTVTKVWNDNNNQDGLRAPATVTLRERVWDKTSGQYGTATDVDTGTLSVANDATVTFSDLPAIKNGKPVMYSVVEAQVPNYEAPVVTGNQVDGFTVTNTHKPAKGCVEVQKIWNDNNNQDGKRKNVTVTLKSTVGEGENANTVVVGSKTIPANVNEPQEAEWHNLPVFRDGQRITYTVEEAPIEGYDDPIYSDGVQLASDGDTKTLTVTNEYTPATTSVTATKVWNDNNNQDGLRANVTLHLKGTIAGSDFVSMNFADKTVATGTNHDQNMTATWENLPVYHDGKEITYTVTEEAIPGYTAEITGNATDGFTVTNSRPSAVTSVTVKKVWNDGNNVDGTRKAATVTLYKQEWDKATGQYGDAVSTGETKTLAVTDNATVTFENLTANANGKPVMYSVVETQVEGYDAPVVTGDQENGFTITNTHTPETIDIQATKVWNDAELMNEEGTAPIEGYDRPKTVSLQLKADGTAVGAPVAVSKSSKVGNTEWAHQWTALPKYKNGGTAIAYTVEEVEVPDGYTVEVTGSMTDGFTVTNTPDVAEILGADLVVKKVDKATGKPMEGVTFTLTSDSVEGFTTVTQATNDGGVATFTFDKVGTYTLTETVPTGYAAPNPASYTITVSKEDSANTHVELEPSNRNAFQKIYDLLFNGGGTGYDADTKTLTVENTPKTSDVTVRKQFVDADTNTPIHSSAIPADFVIHADYTALDGNGVAVEKTATLKVSDAAYSDGTYRWVLEGVAYGTDVHVHEMKYLNATGYDFKSTTVTAPDGAKTHDDDASFTMPDVDAMVTFANSYTKQTGSLELVKNWGDDSNRDRARPQNVSFTVTASAPVFGTAEEPSNTKTVTLTGETTADSWSNTSLTGLPLYYDGTAVTYTVDETTVPTGYTKTIDQPTGVTLTKGTTKTLSITNNHPLQTDSLTVTKVWDDSDDAAGLRPDKVTFHLYKTVSGGADVSAGVDAKTVSGSGSATWTGLPVYDANGTKITYKVVEEAVPGYTATIVEPVDIKLDGDTTADPQTVTVTNSLTPATTSVNVTKVWDDGNNVDGTRKAATVTLYKQEWNKDAGQYGDAVTTGQTKTLAVTDNAEASFENLTAHANGKPIIYSVVEGQVEGYDAPVVAGDQKNGFTITNTHVPNTRTITVTKAWDDAGMSAANYQRPKDISVNLFANGTAVGEARGLSEGNSWATSWTVPVNDADGAITYVVKELNTPTGYTYSGDVTVTGTGDQSVTITNTAEPGEVQNPLEITVRKTNLKGELLPGATFKLEGPNNYLANVTSDADGRFTLTFPKDGTYTLTETNAPTGYKVSDTPITIEVGKQLSEINLQTGSGLWANIYNLFVDTAPEGWDASSKTLTLTNEPQGYTINVTKYFNGIDTLPNTFAFELTYTDAKGMRQVVTNSDAYSDLLDNGKVIGNIFAFRNIPFDSEVSIREIGYQVDGKKVGTEITVNVPNAVTTSDSVSFTMPNDDPSASFTNTYVDDTNVTIPVAKIWDDANDQDSTRPETVTFRLFANGEDTGKTVTLSATDAVAGDANRWAKAEAFTVPTTDETDTPIKYTVREDMSRELAAAGYTDSGEAGADKDYTITNTYMSVSGEINVVKVDSATGDPLAGAEFTLSDPYGTEFTETTGEDGKVTFTLDAEGGWTLVETGVPENHKLDDVYSWTIKTKADKDKVTIVEVTEGEDTFWKKVMEAIVDLEADGFDAGTATLTVKNPPIDEKTITYVDPDPEDPSNVREIQKDTIKVGENEPGQPGTPGKPATPTRDGYEFGGWLREMDDDGNVTYKANWIEIPDPGEKVIQYVDPSKPEGEQEVLREVITRGDNEPAQPKDPERDGWRFTGWKRTIDDDGNVTYTATWEEIPEPERVTITYDPANGEDKTTETIYRNENEPGQPADPTRDGFTFMGWDRVEDENGNVTYKARWKQIPPSEQITVIYDFDNGEGKTETIIERGENEPAQPADPERDGFIFGGWLRDVDKDGNVTYKARWIKAPDPTEKITITRDPGNGADPTVVEIERGENEPGQPGDPMRDGYEFMGWDRTVDPATGNVIYKARWKKLDLTDAITITYDPANGESASSTHIERGTNEPGQPEPPTRDGYIFGGWLRTFDEDGNVTYTANWIETTTPAPETITVTYDPGNGEDPTVNEIERGQNEPGQPKDPTREGYVFGGWLRTQDDAGNVVYKARWIDSTMCPAPTPTDDPDDPSTIWVTYVDPDGKTIYMEKTTIAKSGEKEPPAPANPKREGYVFDGWDRKVDKNGNITYTARWKKTGTGTPSTPPEVTERSLITTPLSETGETVGTVGAAAFMLALLGGGLLTVRRQRAQREE